MNININAMNFASSKASPTDCPDCGGDGCDWDTYPNAEGVAELCASCDGTGEASK